MASGVNVKMGVSGVQQFKQGMKQAQASVKTLDQALKLNEQQFKANGDAQTYMAQKSELLERQISAQKTVVQQAEQALKAMKQQGIDPASTAYQNMQQQMLKAQGDLLSMQTGLQNVGDAGTEAGNGVDHMNQQLQSIGRHVDFDAVIGGLNKVTDGMKNAAKQAFKMGQRIFTATLDSAAWADELMTEATKNGITPEQLQRMRMTADLIDTDADTILSARDKLQKNMNSKSKETMGAFAALGLDPKQHEKEEDIFWGAGEALMGMTDKVNQETYAQQIFGKSWKELIPLFKAGREEYEKTMESWSVVSDENIEKLGQLDDSWQKFQNEFETLKNTTLAELAPAIQMVTDALTELMRQFNQYLQTEEGKEAMASLGEAVKSLFSGIKDIDFADVMEKAKAAIEGVKTGLDWIRENGDTIIKVIAGITAGFVALKVATFGLNVAKTVSGLVGLFHGGNAAGAAAGAAGAAGSSAAGTAAGSAAGHAGMTVGGVANAVAGIAGMGAIIAGFTAAVNERRNNPFIRGSGAAVEQAASGNNELAQAFIAYTRAEQDLQAAMDGGVFDDKTLTKLVDQVEATRGAFNALEGHEKLMQTYSDWRQENSYGNTYWGLPENMNTLLPETQLNESVNNLNDSTAKMTEAADNTTKAVKDMTAGAIKPADLAKFQALPAQIQAAVANGVRNIKVYIDGQQAGGAITPYVNRIMGGLLQQTSRG